MVVVPVRLLFVVVVGGLRNRSGSPLLTLDAKNAAPDDEPPTSACVGESAPTITPVVVAEPAVNESVKFVRLNRVGLPALEGTLLGVMPPFSGAAGCVDSKLVLLLLSPSERADTIESCGEGWCVVVVADDCVTVDSGGGGVIGTVGGLLIIFHVAPDAPPNPSRCCNACPAPNTFAVGGIIIIFEAN